MSESSTILILASLSILLGLWSLIKAFRTRAMVRSYHTRLSEHRKMMKQSLALARASYNVSKELQKSLMLITASREHDEGLEDSEDDSSDFTGEVMDAVQHIEPEEEAGPRFRAGY